MLTDEELGRRIVAEAHEHVRDFDWADVAERTLEVYDALLPPRQCETAAASDQG